MPKGDIWLANTSGEFEEWVPSSTAQQHRRAHLHAGQREHHGRPAPFSGTASSVQLDRAMIDSSGTLYLNRFTSAYPRNATLDSFFGEAGDVIEEFPNFPHQGFWLGPLGDDRLALYPDQSDARNHPGRRIHLRHLCQCHLRCRGLQRFHRRTRHERFCPVPTQAAAMARAWMK